MEAKHRGGVQAKHRILRFLPCGHPPAGADPAILAWRAGMEAKHRGGVQAKHRILRFLPCGHPPAGADPAILAWRGAACVSSVYNPADRNVPWVSFVP
jgi:hypothetical protein